MTKHTVLVAEDDDSIRLVISQTLTADGYAVRATSSVDALKKWVREGEGDVVVTDVYLGESSIFDSMQTISLERPDLPIIVMSGQNTILTAAAAAEQGAFDYLPKPFDIEWLSTLVSRALKKAPKAGQRRMDRETRDAERNASLPLIGRSESMQNVYRIISRVMNTGLPILIEGEVGTEKELTARAIHDLSQYSDKPFVTLNLESLSSAEVGQAFQTLPDEGQHTVYVEEVGGLSQDAQARLLHLLHTPKKARIIASTSKDIEDVIEAGTFRSDLYYSVNTVRLKLPALRDRREDIPELAAAFLVMAREQGLPEKRIDPSGLKLLSAYKWPGNVRELQNIILRLCALSPTPQILAEDVKSALHFDSMQQKSADTDLSEQIEQLLQKFILPQLNNANPENANNIYQSTLAEFERPLISLALKVTSGNKVKAAALLGVNRNTLRSKMKLLKLDD